MVTDNTTLAGYGATLLTDVNGTLFFRALGSNDPTFVDNELWKSDGTTAGKVLVKHINPGAGTSNPANFVLLADGTLFFMATTRSLSNPTRTRSRGLRWRTSTRVESVSICTLTERLGRLSDERMREICAALAVAVACA